jgi:hypothetical protein
VRIKIRKRLSSGVSMIHTIPKYSHTSLMNILLGYPTIILVLSLFSFPFYPFISIGPAVPFETIQTVNRQTGSQHGRLYES